MSEKRQFDIILPIPPTCNGLYTPHWRNRTISLSQQGKSYRTNVRWLVFRKMKAEGFEPFDRPVEIEVHMYLKERRKRDVDNINKCLFDALQDATLITDDDLVFKQSVEKWYNGVGRHEIHVFVRDYALLSAGDVLSSELNAQRACNVAYRYS